LLHLKTSSPNQVEKLLKYPIVNHMLRLMSLAVATVEQYIVLGDLKIKSMPTKAKEPFV
jgi:hypothetical protein